MIKDLISIPDGNLNRCFETVKQLTEFANTVEEINSLTFRGK